MKDLLFLIVKTNMTPLFKILVKCYVKVIALDNTNFIVVNAEISN